MGEVAAYSALGVVFDVASDNIDVLEMIDRIYVHCRVDADATHHFEIVEDASDWALGLDGTAVLRDAPASLTLERMAWEVNQLAWGSDAPGVFVHAGALVVDGAGVMLCAGSGRGKSTLTMGLCERGASYLSDEIAVLDLGTADAANDVVTMRGFPRPIALRHGSWLLVEKLTPNSPAEVADFMDDVWFVVPPEIERAWQLDAIVFPIYEADAPDRLEPITEAEAAAIVSDQAPNLARLGADAPAAIERLVASKRLARLVYSDLDAACALVATAVAS